jgi:hypothetical protein
MVEDEDRFFLQNFVCAGIRVDYGSGSLMREAGVEDGWKTRGWGAAAVKMAAVAAVVALAGPFS